MRGEAARALAKLNKGLDELLDVFVEMVKSVRPEATIILFGSRARGDHLPYSDYDIAVILPGPEDPVKVVEELRRLKPPRLPADIIVVHRGQLGDPLVARMLRRCRILYDGLGLSGELEALGCKAWREA